MKGRAAHRGGPDDPARFAPNFVRGRLGGFQKDIQICLTGIPAANRAGLTHAYFPALATCCATLEYLARLYHGKALDRRCGRRQIEEYAGKFLPGYDAEMIRILFDAFRNAVAHRGIASGIWIDRHQHRAERRIVWKVSALDDGPALEVLADQGELEQDPPWRCRYTHRVHIRLQRLAQDICASADRYIDALVGDRELRDKFMECMLELYPRD